MIEIDNSQLKRAFQNLRAGLPLAVSEGLMAAATAGANRAKTQTYYTPRGGNGLQDNTFAVSISQFTKGVTTNKFYASWVNFGNGPPGGKIYPTQSNNLKFMIDGELFFRKWVSTSEPKPFFTKMVEWEKTELPRILVGNLNRFFNSI